MSVKTDPGLLGAPRRPGGRSARVRAAILDATLGELAEVGYAALSFESIARRAGVHKTTVYRHWGSREDLVKEALLARTAARVPVPDTGSVRDDLIEFGKALLANITTPQYEAIIRAVAGVSNRTDALDRMGRDFWDHRFALARVIVSRGIERGELPHDIDQNLLIEMLIGPLYLRLLITRQPLEESYVERVVDQLLGRRP
jgi:AcrR family transcriptional regulator